MSFERYIFLLFLYKQISARGEDDRNDLSICADNGLTDNKCIATTTEYNTDGTISRYVNYLGKCKKKTQYCQTVTYANRDIGFCAKIIHQGRPGDKCKAPGDCYSGLCEQSKCVGKTEDSFCVSSLECEKQYACVYKDQNQDNDVQVCKPLVKSGESCSFGSSTVQRRDPYYTPMFNFITEREDNCYPGYICTIVALNEEKYTEKANSHQYKCISKFSVLDGQYVDYKNYCACKSGYMILDENERYGICKNVTTNENKLKCIESSDGKSFCKVDNQDSKMECVTDSSQEIFCPVLNLTERINNYSKIFNHYIATAGIDFDEVLEKETAGNERVRETYLFLKYYQYFRNAKECQYLYYLNINLADFIKFDFKLIFGIFFIIF